MIVYSVSITDPNTGDEQLFGPWAAEWMAEAFAETASRQWKRTIIRWQMLNAEDRRVFPPEILITVAAQKGGEAK